LFDFDAKVKFDRAYDIKYLSKSPSLTLNMQTIRGDSRLEQRLARDLPTQHRTKTEQNYEN